MKKIVLFLSIAFVSLTSFSYKATAPDINQVVLHAFNQKFTNARDIQWENKPNLIKAQFILNDQVLNAWFNRKGNLLAITRFICPTELPADLLNTLKKDYAGSWITDLFEMQTETATTYYVTMENADEKIILQSDTDGSGEWHSYKTERKMHAK